MKLLIKTIACMCVTVTAAVTLVLAQHPDAGTEIFDFLDLNYDARSVSMAGASAALPNDCYGMFSNPAALGFTAVSQAMVGYRQVGAGIFGAPLVYAVPVPGKGTFGFSAVGLTSGAVQVTDLRGDGPPELTGNVARADYYSGNIAWARKIGDDLAAGVSVKGLYNYLSDGADYWSADGFAVDGGLQYRSFNSRLMYGFVLHNIGLLRSGYEDDDRYPLPASVEIGVSYVPRYISMLRLSLDLNKKMNDYLLFEPGVECEVVPGQMMVRIGWAKSWRDMESFLNKLQGETESVYYRTYRATFCLGVGLLTELIDRKLKLDAGIEFSDAQIAPALVFSMISEL
jgi:hypothetical protein